MTYGYGMECLMDITAFHNKTEMFGILNKTKGKTHSMHFQYKTNSQTNAEVCKGSLNNAKSSLDVAVGNSLGLCK